jgi:hypothetical protein
MMSNSRGPATLQDLVGELGPLALAGTGEEAAAAGDIVVVTIPLKAYRSVPAGPLAGRVVIDTTNYYPQRDGQIADLDSGLATSRPGRLSPRSSTPSATAPSTPARSPKAGASSPAPPPTAPPTDHSTTTPERPPAPPASAPRWPPPPGSGTGPLTMTSVAGQPESRTCSGMTLRPGR